MLERDAGLFNKGVAGLDIAALAPHGFRAMTRLSILLIVITALLLAPPSGVWAARDCAGPGINH